MSEHRFQGPIDPSQFPKRPEPIFVIPQQRVYDAIAGVTTDFIAGDPPQLRIWRHTSAILEEGWRRDVVFDNPDGTPGSFGTLVSPCPPSREAKEGT